MMRLDHFMTQIGALLLLLQLRLNTAVCGCTLGFLSSSVVPLINSPLIALSHIFGSSVLLMSFGAPPTASSIVM
jgi:hypothetical protein